MSISQLTENASVLNTQQLSLLQQLTTELNPIQQAWVSGYLAATSQLAHQGPAAAGAVPAPTPVASQKLTIIYGSQTGNAKGIAQQVEQASIHKGFNTTVISAGDYKVKQIAKETYVILIVSTHGEGEPPEDAESLHKFVFGKKAPDLSKLKFAVLSLGDSSYEFFCQTGKDFDEQFEKLGGTRLFDRVDCDVDYETDSQNWSQNILDILEPELKQGGDQPAAEVIALNPTGVMAHQYSKNNPFAATLSIAQKVTGRESSKDVRHIEIDLADSDIQYLPGDSLGVWFDNDPTVVSQLLALLNIDADEQVAFDGDNTAIEQLLTSKLELTQLHPGFVTRYAELINNDALNALAADKDQVRQYIADRQVIDVVREYPSDVSGSDFVSALRKITPRLYSIASAQSEVEEEVHLTVGVVEYEAFGEAHLGGASGFLAHRLAEDASVNVYVEPNNNFRLPQDENTPVIMVGPGTGIAPFRAFLQERDVQEAAGKNWLFFGNPHFTQDFLYQTELQDFKKRGVLNQLDVAFSRDQANKVYVQDRLLENAAQVYQWLQDGAHIYICGDGARMAKDVHQALLTIISEQGNLDAEQADEYLDELRTSKRYQKDVY